MRSHDAIISKYSLNETGEFIIDGYNSAKPFSSFFPGIAGADGIPMWVFYVNRGQCISSMGIQDKDHSIMEFLPANRAYNLTASHGFRTFIKLSGNSPVSYYEPFQTHYRDNHLNRVQRIIIAPSGLTLEEVNYSLSLKFTVDYFTVPGDRFAGLIRSLRIENVGDDRVDLEGLDGLPVIVPYGVDNFSLKNMRRTIEAFLEVGNFDNRVPFFKAKVEAADRPHVKKITGGNFYIGFEERESKTNIISPIVDPGRIFGTRTDLSYPERFLEVPLEDMTKGQKLENQFPCAMGMFTASIPAGEIYNYSSIVGHASSLDTLNKMVSDIARREYIESKELENRNLIETLTQTNLICSNEPALDHYVRQNFLDNTIRGGFPFTLTASENRSTLHLYSRKHGDLERDYNDFSLTPTQYSQGNGNFRDINQNRRNDLFFNPDIGKENVEYFYNLIQLDGFNPLVLKEIYFTVDDLEQLHAVLETYVEAEHLQTISSFVNKSFRPGELTAFLIEHNIPLNVDSEVFLGEILNHCSRVSDTEYGESYWIDHWTYNLDLLENYLAVHPDKFPNLLFNERTFSFYDNPYFVRPRDEKYVLCDNQPMQLGAVLLDKEKAHAIEKRKSNRNLVRVEYGKADIYYTTLFNKILCLIVNKLASLDPEGIGVEMEAGKPGWYDALNGLPLLFGSSISETIEIKRHILFLLDKIREYNPKNKRVFIFEELKEFMNELNDLLGRRTSPFEFWEAASTAKERYRDRTRFGVNGKEITIELNDITDFFEAALDKLNEGIEKGRDEESNTIFTYFRHEVTDYEELEVADSRGEKTEKRNADGLVCIRPLGFRPIPLPLFLEGPVHYLRCLPGKEEASRFAASIRKSALFDKSLKMYKVNASLAGEPMEIGRARVFSPGWLENESIWLHMEYKYMLELLRNELYDDFYGEFRNLLIPFLDPVVYGRSILENSSFIVSSAHPETSIHGNGFVARLSGATAEFIHILLMMVLGRRPFRLDQKGGLQLCLEPSLPGWLFTRKERKIEVLAKSQRREIEIPARSFSFMLFGNILVTYHNNSLKDTYGEDGVKPVSWVVCEPDGNEQTFRTETLSGAIVGKIRERKVSKIDIILS